MKAVKLLCAKLHIRYAMLAPVPRLAVSRFILQAMKAGGVGMRPGCLSLSFSVVNSSSQVRLWLKVWCTSSEQFKSSETLAQVIHQTVCTAKKELRYTLS